MIMLNENSGASRFFVDVPGGDHTRTQACGLVVLVGGRTLLRKPSRLPLDPREQLRHRDPESGRDPRQILQAQIRLAALDRPHERAVNPAMICESLLRVAGLQAEFPNALPNCLL